MRGLSRRSIVCHYNHTCYTVCVSCLTMHQLHTMCIMQCCLLYHFACLLTSARSVPLSVLSQYPLCWPVLTAAATLYPPDWQVLLPTYYASILLCHAPVWNLVLYPQVLWCRPPRKNGPALQYLRLCLYKTQYIICIKIETIKLNGWMDGCIK